ncbi:hypothetical protein BDY19DRAFT_919833 [Irpex rosettiformis]|uniref:Uncharacterized protein n=1 Tax=Irpex rosettiformis TaxID=378272 RepID=A0ACB8UIM3_9APHY|nr:hypothetical protein BDY19DRAFT_919833 [Irpex rosettiformis]
MRSHLLLRRTRSLLKPSSTSTFTDWQVQRAHISSTRAPRYPRKEPTARGTGTHLTKRSSSSVTSTSTGANPDEPNEDPNESQNEEVNEPEKDRDDSNGSVVNVEDVEPEKPVRRRTRVPKEPPSENPSPSPPPPPVASSSLPLGLDVLWLPDDLPVIPASFSSSDPPTEATPPNSHSHSVLPPPEIFQEVLTNFLLTLHPQTQHKAAYASSTSGPVEPTLALYCPIEGGDYIIDDTVRELGRRTGAEVVVLDAVQLAAGECGQFGKAASVLQLPNNPLHFAAPPSMAFRSPSNSVPVEEEEDDDEYEQPLVGRLTLQLVTPVTSARPGRTVVSPSRRPSTSMAKVKTFFDELVNVQAPSAPVQAGNSPTEASSTPAPAPQSRRIPRIIYVRDFPTLAASSASWYPALLAAVRSRRQGPMPRQNAPVHSPTTIVFGITPSMVSPLSGSSQDGSGPRGLVNLLMSRSNINHAPSGSRHGRAEYGESEAAEKARERRLRERLRRWERGDPTLHEELPRLTSATEGEEGANGQNVVIMGGAGHSDFQPGLPSFLANALGPRMQSRDGSSSAEDDRPAKFYRTSIIVPGSRSHAAEKKARIERRREINELTMRMGVAAVGGTLPKLEGNLDEALDGVEAGGTGEPDHHNHSPAALRMWEDWGRRVEVWRNVRKIADRAVGKVIAAKAQELSSSPSTFWHSHGLDTVPVDWETVFESWTVHKASRDMRKAWLQHSSGKAISEVAEEETTKHPETVIDEVVERVKRDPDLDQHEQRLLGCIVDTNTISTTFDQVHLPPRTIDAVRTIVSLPLLHPSAFQQGILKEHAMTGCLLFGPPGTGKTLIVRALAKEAGCRMMVVSPSDVMDMYVGEGEKLVRSVFTLARRLSPCVVFIDEIDALFGARMAARESGGAIAHRGVITEFMQEMDGLKTSKDDNIIVIGATNRPFDLDDAILRRLPRRLLVDLPGEAEREGILKILLRDEPLAADVDLKVLSHKTESFSGSDLKHLCVSAALDAVKEHVELPWRPAPQAPMSTTAMESSDSTPTPESTVEPQVGCDSTPDAGDLEEASNYPAIQTNPLVPSDVKAEMPSRPVTEANTAVIPHRTLHWRNFLAALKEITPSSSEALGTLSDLRKWNEEFGEGRKEKKKQVWGKGRFGFTPRPLGSVEEGKVRNDSLSGEGTTSGGQP